MPLPLEKQNGTGCQYLLRINRRFVEMSGLAEAVPLPFDISQLTSDEKDPLILALEGLDGILFTGGFLNLRKIEEAPL